MSYQNDGGGWSVTQLNSVSVLKLTPTGFASGTDVGEKNMELREAARLLG